MAPGAAYKLMNSDNELTIPANRRRSGLPGKESRARARRTNERPDRGVGEYAPSAAGPENRLILVAGEGFGHYHPKMPAVWV